MGLDLRGRCVWVTVRGRSVGLELKGIEREEDAAKRKLWCL